MVLYNLLNLKYHFEKEYLQFGNKCYDATVQTVLGYNMNTAQSQPNNVVERKWDRLKY